jgi:hypothetical protein
MALAVYDDLFWFPNGAMAANVPARIFPEESSVLAPLFSDATGLNALPNPLNTGSDGRLRFWAETGYYWVHIDSESFRVGVGVSDEGISLDDVRNVVTGAITDYNTDTTASTASRTPPTWRRRPEPRPRPTPHRPPPRTTATRP